MEDNDLIEYLRNELALLDFKFDDFDKLNTEALEILYDYITELHEKGQITPVFSAGDLTNFKGKH